MLSIKYKRLNWTLCDYGYSLASYGATNVAPTQKDNSLVSSSRRSQFQAHKRSWNEHKLGQVISTGPKPKTTVLASASRNLLD
jgi:hypothetical protein